MEEAIGTAPSPLSPPCSRTNAPGEETFGEGGKEKNVAGMRGTEQREGRGQHVEDGEEVEDVEDGVTLPTPRPLYL